MNKHPIIQLKGISKTFGNRKVLIDVNLSIFKGDITSIIGTSGVGKSVLLKHIIGLIKPDSGEILFDGKSLGDMKNYERRTLKKKISYMFQNNALFDSMTVFENISLPLNEGSYLPKLEVKERVKEKMFQLGLYDAENKYPSQISGGMKKRVALARALITDPEIILFDEPTTGLDPILKKTVHNMIADYQKKFGFTGVVISHEIPDIFYISQRIAMLNKGYIIFEGSKEDIKNSNDSFIKEFISF